MARTRKKPTKPEPNPEHYTRGVVELDTTERYYPPCLRINGIIVAYPGDNWVDRVAGQNHMQQEDEANARRLVALWNACDGIPTQSLERNVIGKLWIKVSELCDLVEGKKVPVSDRAAYKAHVVEEGRKLVACLNSGLKEGSRD